MIHGGKVAEELQNLTKEVLKLEKRLPKNGLASTDDLFSTEEGRARMQSGKIQEIHCLNCID